MTAILERLNRWVQALPSNDSIPVTHREADILAEGLSKNSFYFKMSNASSDPHVLRNSLQKGTFRFCNHKVFVL
jgi:hypothetical protein